VSNFPFDTPRRFRFRPKHTQQFREAYYPIHSSRRGIAPRSAWRSPFLFVAETTVTTEPTGLTFPNGRMRCLGTLCWENYFLHALLSNTKRKRPPSERSAGVEGGDGRRHGPRSRGRRGGGRRRLLRGRRAVLHGECGVGGWSHIPDPRLQIDSTPPTVANRVQVWSLHF
jgi:hypothetical protein